MKKWDVRVFVGLLGGALSLTTAAACGGEEEPVPPGGSSSGSGNATEDGGEPFSSGGDVTDGSCDLSGPDACSTCMVERCATEGDACFCAPPGADTCDSYFDALIDCENPDAAPDCEAQAATRFPRGSAAAQAYDQCERSKCASECSAQ